jgi:hypothetical protein
MVGTMWRRVLFIIRQLCLRYSLWIMWQIGEPLKKSNIFKWHLWILHLRLPTLWHTRMQYNYKIFKFEHYSLSIFKYLKSIWCSYFELLMEISSKEVGYKMYNQANIHSAYCDENPVKCCGILNLSWLCFSIEPVEHTLWWYSFISVERKFSLNSLIMMLCCINKSLIMLNQLDTLD